MLTCWLWDLHVVAFSKSEICERKLHINWGCSFSTHYKLCSLLIFSVCNPWDFNRNLLLRRNQLLITRNCLIQLVSALYNVLGWAYTIHIIPVFFQTERVFPNDNNKLPVAVDGANATNGCYIRMEMKTHSKFNQESWKSSSYCFSFYCNRSSLEVSGPIDSHTSVLGNRVKLTFNTSLSHRIKNSFGYHKIEYEVIHFFVKDFLFMFWPTKNFSMNLNLLNVFIHTGHSLFSRCLWL